MKKLEMSQMEKVQGGVSLRSYGVCFLAGAATGASILSGNILGVAISIYGAYSYGCFSAQIRPNLEA